MLVEQLVRRAPWLAPDLHFLLLKHPRAVGPLCEAPNVTERVVPWEANGPVTLFCLPRVVDLRGTDVFHAPYNILPAGLDMPAVATIHDLMWLKRPELSGSGAWGKVEALFYRHGIRRALARAASIVTVSEATRADIRSIDEPAHRRTMVIPPALLDDFRPLTGHMETDAARRARERWLPDTARYVLTVGQSSPYKNHETVIRAFALAFAQQREFKLVVIHRLGDDTNLRRLTEQVGLHGRVVFFGEIPRSDLVALYNGATALCHPSLWEGFGLPLIEAMACGCPVITSPCASMPEVAGPAAIYASPVDAHAVANALRLVAFEPRVAALLRERGLARVHALPSWNDFALAHVNLYRRLMDRRTPLCESAPDRDPSSRAA
jgi:glycosyltransferase involved in cell wall biosynthesis